MAPPDGFVQDRSLGIIPLILKSLACLQMCRGNSRKIAHSPRNSKAGDVQNSWRGILIVAYSRLVGMDSGRGENLWQGVRVATDIRSLLLPDLN